MWKKIKVILQFNWLSKKFFIRMFLITALIAEWFGLYSMIQSKKPDYSVIITIIGTIGGLLTAYTVRKYKQGE